MKHTKITSDELCQAVKDMVDSYRALTGSYASAAGYLESVVRETLLQLPQRDQARYLEEFQAQARRNQDRIILEKLKVSP